jgi:uncharacterized phage-associated protein
MWYKVRRKEKYIMANVYDVAAYILEKQGETSTMKLQKLVYYSQAWSLVWDDKPLFEEPIQAWINGPVVPELYKTFQGEFSVKVCSKGDSKKLTDSEKETIDVVLGGYGNKNAQELSDLTHRETPWQDTRKGLSPSERGESVISLTSIQEYYASLPL